ncbi:transposase family protein [Streptomyces mirabilis]|uniref:transposase family protein n=1 Tax=Streptomyces mirabilis TaxID=68239 RepID=UPI0036AFFCB6
MAVHESGWLIRWSPRTSRSAPHRRNWFRLPRSSVRCGAPRCWGRRCPGCRKQAARGHGSYQRMLDEGPLGGRRVMIPLRARRAYGVATVGRGCAGGYVWRRAGPAARTPYGTVGAGPWPSVAGVGEELEHVATSGGFLLLPLSSADALGVSPLTEEVLDAGRGTEKGWRSGGISRRRPQGP